MHEHQRGPGEFSFQATLPFEPTVAHHGRALLHEHLRLQLPAATLLDVELVIAELATNAFVFGAAPVVLRLNGTTERIRVEMRDASAVLPHLADPKPNGGFGLRIVAELADRWGAERSAIGKVVWAEIPVSSGQHGDLDEEWR